MNMPTRNYRQEYLKYHSRPDQIRKRSLRNSARRLMIKDGRASKGDGMEVDHRHPLSKGGSNRLSNLRVVTRHTNRVKGNRA